MSTCSRGYSALVQSLCALFWIGAHDPGLLQCRSRSLAIWEHLLWYGATVELPQYVLAVPGSDGPCPRDHNVYHVIPIFGSGWAFNNVANITRLQSPRQVDCLHVSVHGAPGCGTASHCAEPCNTQLTTSCPAKYSLSIHNFVVNYTLLILESASCVINSFCCKVQYNSDGQIYCSDLFFFFCFVLKMFWCILHLAIWVNISDIIYNGI